MLKGPLIGYRGRSISPKGDRYDELIILDIGSASYRIVWNELMAFAFPVKWHGNGCLHEMWNGALFDLEGNVISEGLDLNLEILLSKSDAERPHFTLLSPDRRWWAYVYGHGEQFDGLTVAFEFYDIALIDTEHPDDPIFITDDGVSNYFSWSQDSQWLYYEGTDENDVNQFYRYSPVNGQNEQLTFFDDPNKRMFPRVSPDNRFLATAVYEDPYWFVDDGEMREEVQPLLEIVDLSDLSMKEFLLETVDNGHIQMKPRSIWWSSNEPTVAVLGEDNAGDKQVFWVDTTNGEFVDLLFADELPWDSGGGINPAGSGDHLLLSSSPGEHYLFDRASGEMTILPVELPDYIIYDMNIAPFDFPGEDNCEN